MYGQKLLHDLGFLFHKDIFVEKRREFHPFTEDHELIKRLLPKVYM